MKYPASKHTELRGWRYGAFITGIMTITGAMVYAVIIDPLLHPEKWQERQKIVRAGIKQEDIQPAGLRVWSDPFKERKD